MQIKILPELVSISFNGSEKQFLVMGNHKV